MPRERIILEKFLYLTEATDQWQGQNLLKNLLVQQIISIANFCRDPESLPAPAKSFQRALLDLPYAEDGLRARIAWAGSLGRISPVDPEVRMVCRCAVDWFEEQGASVDYACPDLSDAEEIFQVSCPRHGKVCTPACRTSRFCTLQDQIEGLSIGDSASEHKVCL